MKKLFALLLVLVMALGLFAACGTTEPAGTTAPKTDDPAGTTAPAEETLPEGVMTHAEYEAAAMDSQVTVHTYVQAVESWWDGKVQIYAQSKDGAYYIYNLACTEEEAAKLVPGTKINIKGYKTFYKGMPEIAADGAVLTILEGEDTFIAPAEILTDMLGKQELVNKAGAYAAFQGMTISKIEYRNGEPGDDIYVDLTLGDKTYSFCVERYLTDPETDVYKAFVNEDLKVGDVVNVYGFVYWYDADEDGQSGDGINTHITKITKG